MEVQELRMGNYVYFQGGLEEIVCIRIEEVNLSHVGNEHWTTDININLIEPIPLTEEWLLKFGFFWKNGMLRNGHFRVMEKQEQFGGGFNVYLDSINVDHIKYIHQLQNLYFALTGTELTIKN